MSPSSALDLRIARLTGIDFLCHTYAEYEKIVQKLRSNRWRSVARLPGWGGGAGGRKEVTGALAYQRIKRFPERWGGGGI